MKYLHKYRGSKKFGNIKIKSKKQLKRAIAIRLSKDPIKKAQSIIDGDLYDFANELQEAVNN